MENIFILKNEAIRHIVLIPTGQGEGIKEGIIDEDYIFGMAITSHSILNMKSVEEAKASGWVLDTQPWTMGVAFGKMKEKKDGNNIFQKL